VNDNTPPTTTGKSENSTQAQTPIQQTPEGRQHEISDHLDRAQALFKAEQYSGAINECNAVLKLDPGNAAAKALKTQIEQTRKLLEQ
jgi:Flp pilus assembly protein TadD